MEEVGQACRACVAAELASHGGGAAVAGAHVSAAGAREIGQAYKGGFCESFLPFGAARECVSGAGADQEGVVPQQALRLLPPRQRLHQILPNHQKDAGPGLALPPVGRSQLRSGRERASRGIARVNYHTLCRPKLLLHSTCQHLNPAVAR